MEELEPQNGHRDLEGAGHVLGNGHAHRAGPEVASRSGNPYVEAATGSKPKEIVDYEKASDPYTNMLPGISSINAAKTIRDGVQVGRKGNRLIMAVSLVLLIVLLLPAILAIISQLSR